MSNGHSPDDGHECIRCGTEALLCTIEDGACDFFVWPYCSSCSDDKAYEEVERQIEREEVYGY